MKDIKLINNESLDSKGLRVFNKFSNISVFIDYKKFLDLDVRNLKKFNYEISDFYYKNLSLENRKLIDNKDGKSIFTLSDNNLEAPSKESGYHEPFSNILKKYNYEECVSIEMKEINPWSTEKLSRILKFVKDTY